MNTQSSVDLVMFGRGLEPMSLVKRIEPDELPESEDELASALEMAVKAINSFERAERSQIVFMQDGLLIAVEDQKTGNLIWCG
ncbi:hypothetical protein RMSM_06519 [Rhodopirellula maiorica SM1]|uniref:Uncharacterized protein n=1 Tax=Rhodopirellula maiorica SM1 TaxID=1265738 RepID=M5RAP2_9BACT|nr:hypothetical protein [Rhodopirellula maiorica]EMI16563.1 hypothetical protein RMSM_06519 [Rhodopirellula maiorica SM1]